MGCFGQVMVASFFVIVNLTIALIVGQFNDLVLKLSNGLEKNIHGCWVFWLVRVGVLVLLIGGHVILSSGSGHG